METIRNRQRMRPRYFLWAAGIAAVTLMGCRKAETEQSDFDHFLQQEFVSAMESDYTTLHVYLQDPKAHGIDMDQVEIGLGMRPDPEGLEAQKKDVRDSYEELKRFNRNLLTEEQKDIYDSYEWQLGLEQEAADEVYDYYPSLFGSMTGIHYQIPTLLADWEIRTEEDVQNLITVVEDVKPYVETALEYTKIQEEKGLLMLDLDSVIQYCTSILDKGEDSAVLQSMDAAIGQAGLDEKTAGQYREMLRSAFLESVLPAYEEIRDTMVQFQSGNNQEEGLANLEHGKDYYEILFKQSIGSDRSVEDIKAMMEEELQEHALRLSEIVNENPSLAEAASMPETGFEDYYEILDHIKERMSADFPEVGQLDYNIETISEEIASDSGVTAYFNIPPLDGDSEKQLRVNPKTNDIASLNTYQTVAHEGFPGHMYQYAYMYENLNTPFQKAILNNPAYTEGYATYAQYEAGRYLDGIDADWLQLYQENDLMTNCLVILMDIGIHYEGWSMEDMGSFLDDFGLGTDEESLEGMYRQLQANPCAFEPYYVGYFEIENLKEQAQESLGERFDQKKFHEAILKGGNVSFPVVEKNVTAYIEANR
ncbi:MAG: DUF885 domain-containing protein [Lachnospiraceae bacterium]